MKSKLKKSHNYNVLHQKLNNTHEEEINRLKPVVFIGPYELSQSLGIPGEVNHSVVIEKMKEVVLKCKQNKIAVGR